MKKKHACLLQFPLGMRERKMRVTLDHSPKPQYTPKTFKCCLNRLSRPELIPCLRAEGDWTEKLELYMYTWIHVEVEVQRMLDAGGGRGWYDIIGNESLGRVSACHRRARERHMSRTPERGHVLDALLSPMVWWKLLIIILSVEGKR